MQDAMFAVRNIIPKVNEIFLGVDEITRYTIIFVVAVTISVILLRILLSIKYQGSLAAVAMSKKEKKSKLVQKVLDDYKDAADRGVVNIDTEEMVNRHMLKLNILGWNLESMENLVKKAELQSAFIVIAAIILPDTNKLWCGTALVIMLFCFWFLGSIFDFEASKKKLKSELINYVEHKEGVFYSKDLGSIILSLKSELGKVIVDNNKMLKESIDKLNTELNLSIKDGKDAIVSTTETSMKSLVDYAEILKEPMENWKNMLINSGKIQSEMNISTDKMSETMSKFETIYQKLDRSLDTKNENTKEMTAALTKQAEQLFTAVEAVQESTKNAVKQNEILENHLDFVKENQRALEISLQQYEFVLQNMSKEMGIAIGNIVDVYSKNSAKDLSDKISEITEKVNIANKILIESINENIENINKQNIIQQQSMFDMREELEDIRNSVRGE